ncbi:MAG TPA: cation ABC transporter permease [Verrucomicrobia bacterium]|nr:cation ABC transporter permease [Verrucomicrobiota bacterium]
MFELEFLRYAIAGCVLTGVALSLVGVLLLLMDLPFLGICLSHAAFLGAVLAVVAGWHPLAGALPVCALAVLVIWPMAERMKAGTNGALSVVMAGTMGLAFVFMNRIPGPKSEALMLIWGSVLTLTPLDLACLAGTALGLIVLITVFYRWLTAVLYDREVALSSGVPAGAVLFGVLLLAGTTVSVSLNIVGGLLIFALLVNPASAAYHLTDQLRWTFVLAALFGVISTLGGLWLSYQFDLPAGAAMALVSTAIFFLSLATKK